MMHHRIRFLTTAENYDEAMEKAESMIQELVNDCKIDYGHPEGAMKLSSDDGAEWLLTGLSLDYDDICEGLEQVRDVIKKTNDEIYDSDELSLYWFRKCASTSFVYVEDIGLCRIKDMNWFLTDQNLEKLWVVICDVHT